ncbi:hypothetical protein AWN90_25420 [Nocardia terpenica]|uniref:Inositol monophosphatase n=2 Tax=Nocardia terpenica TaxID=455432 RepID=A0A161WMS1_9NOCA|nr:hypothetical protein AWN90_25420 [Nocardia terpenica]
MGGDGYGDLVVMECCADGADEPGGANPMPVVRQIAAVVVPSNPSAANLVRAASMICNLRCWCHFSSTVLAVGPFVAALRELMAANVRKMRSPAVDPDLLDFAIALADRAGRLAADRFFTTDLAVATKPDGSAVTDADRAVENLIRTELRQRFADDEIYGEEDGTTPGTSGRSWVIDPIDGTTYFAHRIPLFSTRLACYDEHGPAIGVINEPIAQRMVFAGRGLGCRIRTGGRETAPILRHTNDLADARVEIVNPSRWPGDLLMTLHRNVKITGYLGGVAGGLLTGLIDAIVIGGTEQGYEDLAPLPVIVEEAGCVVTDLDGGPLLSGPGSAVISTRPLHGRLLEIIRPTRPARRGV